MRACCCPLSVVIHHQPNLLAISPSPTMTLKSPENRAFVRAHGFNFGATSRLWNALSAFRTAG
jgi:hypothetical protein